MRKDGKIGDMQLDQFAELISRHDLATGDVGGDCQLAARRMGQDHPLYGNNMLQKLRKRLGWQAC